MASSPAEPGALATTPRGVALQEAIACWDQAYEALVRGDLERVEDLMDLAQEHVAAIGDAAQDSPEEARLRQEATSAHGRLAAAMRAGLAGLQEEIARTRKGAKAMRSYAYPGLRVGHNITKNV